MEQSALLIWSIVSKVLNRFKEGGKCRWMVIWERVMIGGEKQPPEN